MQKSQPNYDKTYFYKLCCKDLNITDIYIGHTIYFNTRMNQHKTSCCNEQGPFYNRYVYQYIRDHGHWENWSMIVIEKRKCDDVLDAKKKEREYIESMGSTLNKAIPTRTLKEYYESNKDKLKKQDKEYYETNKDKINERKRQYHHDTRAYRLEKQRQYQINNKDKIKERKRNYYENNKEQIQIRNRELYENKKIECAIAFYS